MAQYYRKTARGQAELEATGRRLPQTLRMLLLLVDGRRSSEELLAMLKGATPEALRSLLHAGLIEPAPPPRRTRTSSGAAAPGARAPDTRPPADSRQPGDSQQPADSQQPVDSRQPGDSRFRSTGPSSRVDSRFDSRFDVRSRGEIGDKERAQVERSLRRALGPVADGLVERVRTARTVGDLVAVLKVAQAAIANARGQDMADEFASRYGGLDEL